MKGTKIGLGVAHGVSRSTTRFAIRQILGVPSVDPIPEELTLARMYNELSGSDKYYPGMKFLQYMDLSPQLRVLRLLIAHCIYLKGGGRNQINP